VLTHCVAKANWFIDDKGEETSGNF